MMLCTCFYFLRAKLYTCKYYALWPHTTYKLSLLFAVYVLTTTRLHNTARILLAFRCDSWKTLSRKANKRQTNEKKKKKQSHFSKQNHETEKRESLLHCILVLGKVYIWTRGLLMFINVAGRVQSKKRKVYTPHNCSTHTHCCVSASLWSEKSHNHNKAGHIKDKSIYETVCVCWVIGIWLKAYLRTFLLKHHQHLL